MILLILLAVAPQYQVDAWLRWFGHVSRGVFTNLCCNRKRKVIELTSITCMHESCHTYTPHPCVTWLVLECDVTHSCCNGIRVLMESIRIRYGVATISRLLKIIGLFCRISSLLYGSFAKETYIFKEPTNRSHPIVSQVTNADVLCLTCQWVMSRIKKNIYICDVTLCIHVCDMIWRIYLCDMTCLSIWWKVGGGGTAE